MHFRGLNFNLLRVVLKTDFIICEVRDRYDQTEILASGLVRLVKQSLKF
jgi:hypothetical protein